MFRRAHHNAILTALRALNGDTLAQAGCFFGGGTAIVLALDEYRESVDIDFLCASQPGYRTLRSAVWDQGLGGLMCTDGAVVAQRPPQTDQYGIRSVLSVDGVPIKFEIIREARIDLSGTIDPRYGLPVLSRDDMYTEKLLANADRWADRAVLSRDIIDLSMMVFHWGTIPARAWSKARSAYGPSVEQAYTRAVDRIRDADWLAHCLQNMAMEASLAAQILALHGGARSKEA